jgi:transposase-like protein
MAKVPASEITCNALHKLLAGKDGSVDMSAMVRQAVQLMIAQALEVEVSERLRRGYYEHGWSSGGPARMRAHRNGVRLGRLKSAEGMIEYAVPQVRGIEAGIRRFARRSGARPRSSSAWRTLARGQGRGPGGLSRLEPEDGRDGG